jgi:hypothetical protein
MLQKSITSLVGFLSGDDRVVGLSEAAAIRGATLSCSVLSSKTSEIGASSSKMQLLASLWIEQSWVAVSEARIGELGASALCRTAPELLLESRKRFLPGGGEGTSTVTMLAVTSVEPSLAVSLPPATSAQVLRAGLASVGEVFSSTAAVIAAPAVVY